MRTCELHRTFNFHLHVRTVLTLSPSAPFTSLHPPPGLETAYLQDTKASTAAIRMTLMSVLALITTVVPILDAGHGRRLMPSLPFAPIVALWVVVKALTVRRMQRSIEARLWGPVLLYLGSMMVMPEAFAVTCSKMQAEQWAAPKTFVWSASVSVLASALFYFTRQAQLGGGRAPSLMCQWRPPSRSEI